MNSSTPLYVPTRSCCARFLNWPVRLPSIVRMLNDWSSSRSKSSSSSISRSPSMFRSDFSVMWSYCEPLVLPAICKMSFENWFRFVSDSIVVAAASAEFE